MNHNSILSYLSHWVLNYWSDFYNQLELLRPIILNFQEDLFQIEENKQLENRFIRYASNF